MLLSVSLFKIDKTNKYHLGWQTPSKSISSLIAKYWHMSLSEDGLPEVYSCKFFKSLESSSPSSFDFSTSLRRVLLRKFKECWCLFINEFVTLWMFNSCSFANGKKWFCIFAHEPCYRSYLIALTSWRLLVSIKTDSESIVVARLTIFIPLSYFYNLRIWLFI